MTSTVRGHQTILNDFFKSIYDGKHQNVAYIYEKSRNIAVIFTYNYQTGRGEYTACIWHHIPGQTGGVSWHRKTHRNTAQERFAKCPRIPFEFTFKIEDQFFFINLKKAIRRTIHSRGVKGIQNSTTAIHTLKEFTPSINNANVNANASSATSVIQV